MIEVILIILAGLASYRIYHLYQNHHTTQMNVDKYYADDSITINYDYDAKMDALKEAQIFSGTQLLPLKRRFGDLSAERFNWLKKASALYLIGAIEHIGNKHQCNSNCRKELTALVLKSNLKIPCHIADIYLNEALYINTNNDKAALVSAGENAAKNWITGQVIAQDITLEESLNRTGIMA